MIAATTIRRTLPAALACCAAAFALALAAPAAAFEKVKVGDKLPAFTLKDTAGADVAIAPGPARVLILFKEGVNTPNALKRVGRSFAAMKDKGVVYLGVYLGKGKPEEAQALAAAENAGFPVLMGTEELYGTLGVKALPTTVWVDKAGTVIHEVNLAPFQLEQEANEYALVALGEKKAEDAELALRPQEAAPVSKEEAEAKKMYGLAMVLMERGMKDKAVAKLQEILKVDPGFCDAHILLGHVYLEDGKIDEAVKEFEYVIKCDPTSNDAKVGLGMAHAKKGETDKALEYFQGALKLNPKPEKVYYEMGKAYEKKGDLAQAVESYKLALKRLFGNQ
ncbi:MAG TPA: tetratricopeptide repeat protein [Candidatus Methanoperedens sp.]|nr:tetratricopeptide repeat protein [Candidatus Methanoperedens sp.]